MIDGKFNYSLYDSYNAQISYDFKLVNDENSFKKNRLMYSFTSSFIYSIAGLDCTK